MPDFKARQKKLLALMERRGLDCVLVTDDKDIFYYTGYRPSERAFLLLKSSSVKLFAGRVDNEAEGRANAEVVFYERLKDVASQLSGKAGIDYAMSVETFLKLRRLAKAARLKDAWKIIKEPRSVKDREEIVHITKAVGIAKAAMNSTSPWGRTEREVAAQLEASMLERGSRRAYPLIVAGGGNSYYIHHTPGDSKITRGPVIIDAGAEVNGYCSDVTRTMLRDPDRSQKGVMEDVMGMHGDIMDFIEPGRRSAEIQKFWGRLMKRKGYKVMHAFGHGIGLDAHEPLDVIKAGSVLTVEPGVYIKGLGGFRIEDTVAVGKKGARVLS